MTDCTRTTPSRRAFLRTLGAGTAGVALWNLIGCGGDTAAKPPNILFVVTDDHRHDFMSCVNPELARTPNIDRLADEGVRFSNAFTTTSLCSPSRAGFLTGCYAHRHGVIGNEGRDLDGTCPTFPALLQHHGYETAYIGKWHMARMARPRPGFDHWISFNGQGEYDRNTLNIDGRWELSEGYITDRLTDYALEYLRRDREKPFMLCVSHKAVHQPFLPARRHNGLEPVGPLPSFDDPGERPDDKATWAERISSEGAEEVIRSYQRTLFGVDENLGRLLDELESQRILDDTVIVYVGDNGYMMGEHGGLWDKRAAFDPSIRIPFLMRYPRRIPEATVCDQLVLNIDLAPTAMDLAGIDPAATMQGASLLDLPGGAPGRPAFLYEYFAEQGNVPTCLAVRTKDWKYVVYPHDPQYGEELYHLAYDPAETINRAGEAAYLDTLTELRAELLRLRNETEFAYPPGCGPPG